MDSLFPFVSTTCFSRSQTFFSKAVLLVFLFSACLFAYPFENLKILCLRNSQLTLGSSNEGLKFLMYDFKDSTKWSSSVKELLNFQYPLPRAWSSFIDETCGSICAWSLCTAVSFLQNLTSYCISSEIKKKSSRLIMRRFALCQVNWRTLGFLDLQISMMLENWPIRRLKLAYR